MQAMNINLINTAEKGHNNATVMNIDDVIKQ
jgi:hypothetical protein